MIHVILSKLFDFLLMLFLIAQLCYIHSEFEFLKFRLDELVDIRLKLMEFKK